VVGNEDRYSARIGNFADARKYLSALRFRSLGGRLAYEVCANRTYIGDLRITSSVSCSRATTASRLAIPSSHSRETLALSGGTVNCGNGGKMPKRCGIGCIGLSLLAALDWCKRTAGRYWPFSAGIVSSITPGHRNDQVEGGQSTKVGLPVQIESRVERIELKEFTKALNIGDRIQVLCDDGVLVAEKISQTQFELIHAQMLSELVH